MGLVLFSCAEAKLHISTPFVQPSSLSQFFCSPLPRDWTAFFFWVIQVIWSNFPVPKRICTSAQHLYSHFLIGASFCSTRLLLGSQFFQFLTVGSHKTIDQPRCTYLYAYPYS